MSNCSLQFQWTTVPLPIPSPSLLDSHISPSLETSVSSDLTRCSSTTVDTTVLTQVWDTHTHTHKRKHNNFSSVFFFLPNNLILIPIQITNLDLIITYSISREITLNSLQPQPEL